MRCQLQGGGLPLLRASTCVPREHCIVLPAVEHSDSGFKAHFQAKEECVDRDQMCTCIREGSDVHMYQRGIRCAHVGSGVHAVSTLRPHKTCT